MARYKTPCSFPTIVTTKTEQSGRIYRGQRWPKKEKKKKNIDRFYRILFVTRVTKDKIVLHDVNYVT